MRVTPLSAVAQLGDGCTMDAISGVLGNYKKTITDRKNNPPQWEFHVYTISDGRIAHEIKFWNRDPSEIDRFVGCEVLIEGTPSQDTGALCGVQVGGGQRGEVSISINERCLISICDTGARPPARPQQQRSYQQQQPTPRTGGYQRPPQQQPYQRPPQQPAPQRNGSGTRPRPTTILGPTVGMAINQAISVIVKGVIEPMVIEENNAWEAYINTPKFSQDIHTIASDIIRVSQLLEGNRLAEPVKSRLDAPEARQEAGIGQEQAPEPQRQQPQAHHEDFGEGPITDGMEDDDIPF